MCGACGLCGGEEKCIHGFREKTLTDHLAYAGMDGKKEKKKNK
jgi:hypothetical protein